MSTAQRRFGIGGLRQVNFSNEQTIRFFLCRGNDSSIGTNDSAMAVTGRQLTAILRGRVSQNDKGAIAKRSRDTPIVSQLRQPFVGIVIGALEQDSCAGDCWQVLDA